MCYGKLLTNKFKILIGEQVKYKQYKSTFSYFHWIVLHVCCKINMVGSSQHVNALLCLLYHVQVSHVNLVWPQLRNVLLYIVITVVTILQLMQFNSSSYFYSYCHDILKWIFINFQDLLNFDDPLNVEAADHYSRNKVCLTCIYLKFLVMYKKS